MPVIIFNNGKVTKQILGGQITGEKIPGDLNSWNLYQNDINEALNSSYGILSQRSSTLYHSFPPLSSAVNKTAAYAIGSGNAFRSHLDYRILGITAEYAKEWGKQFQLLIHYNFKKLSWYQKQGIVFKGAMVLGDSLVYFIRDKDGLDLIEAGGNNIDWEYNTGDDWTLGVKHDPQMRRSALRIGDKTINFKNQKTKDQQILQFYIKSLPRQLRGLPIAYKIIALAKNSDRFLDSTVQRAVLESIMFGYSNTDTTDLNAQAKQQAEAAAKKKGWSGVRSAWSRLTGTKELAGGNIYQLKNDESMQFTDLKTPSNNFGVFNEWIIKYVAMATDTTPGVIMSSYPTSYSSHRGEFNDFWKMVTEKRFIFNETVNFPVIRELAKTFILSGAIKAPGFFEDPIKQQAWLAGSFLGPVPGHINPLQEVKAEALAVENAFILRSDAAANHGNEFDNIINEWAAQEIQFKTLSLTEQEKAIQEGLQNVE